MSDPKAFDSTVENSLSTDYFDQFLTPPQRQTIVADILSDIALRILESRSKSL